MSAQPLTIDKFNSGLVQYQPNQILADDALPVCLNAFTYLHTLQRRKAWNLKGRLSRTLTAASLGNSSASPWTFIIYSTLASPITGEPNAVISIGSVTITIATSPDPIVFTDQGNGTLTSPTMDNSGKINYATGSVVLTTTATPGTATTITFTYFPALPGMGVFDQNNTLSDGTNVVDNIFMDTKYTYSYVGGGNFIQFPTGATWVLDDWKLPSCTNYYFDVNNKKIFWITNLEGTTGIQIQYSNCQSGAIWYPFNPTIDTNDTGQSDVNRLWQAKFLIPFRGRLYAFNTLEGETIAGSVNYVNRIRTSAASTPFTVTNGIVTAVNPNAWNDTIPGQGYTQNLPTNEPIVGASPCMNQIIIKTTTKTYVLTHTGMSVAPFKVDLVDDNEGTASGFSAVNMGSFIQNIGVRSIDNTSPTELKSIDNKIINFVFNISRDNHGRSRVYGVRDFQKRCNSYIFPYQAAGEELVTYPNRRLIYNYENNTWAIYEDSVTCLGYFRALESIQWQNADFSWEEANFPWYQENTNEPSICAINQQGFVGTLDSNIAQGVSLQITAITKQSGDQACIFTSPSHNIENLTIAQISGVIGDWSYLNGIVGQIQPIDTNTFYMFQLNASTNKFSVPVFIPSADMGMYIGGGLLQIRHNFFIQTKPFNFLREGQSIHVPYLDALINVYQGSYVELLVFDSNNTSNPVNTIPQNTTIDGIFGNIITQDNPTTYPLTEVNNRALINQRANMISFAFTLDNATMVSDSYFTPFALSSLTIWRRKAGRPLMPLGGG